MKDCGTNNLTPGIVVHERTGFSTQRQNATMESDHRHRINVAKTSAARYKGVELREVL